MRLFFAFISLVILVRKPVGLDCFDSVYVVLLSDHLKQDMRHFRIDRVLGSTQILFSFDEWKWIRLRECRKIKILRYFFVFVF
jgi:hypothetical protein